MNARPVQAGPGRLPPARRLTVTVVVVLARALSRLSPKHLSAVLRIARRGARPASYEQAHQARATVVRASRRCAGEGCLPRSVAAALLCRLGGTWPTWRVGVMTSPLTAHAWIEAEDRPVDEPQGAEEFRPLMTVGPPPVALAERTAGRGARP
jgi:hypothetical protein